MGFIREPKGVDLFINSGSLTEKDRKEISQFINDYKQKWIEKKQEKKISATKKNNTKLELKK